MTIGIRKERLEKIYNMYRKDLQFEAILGNLIRECKELNPWLPIESAPKDRRLNLYWPNYGWFTGSWRMNQYFCDAGLIVPVNINPTHWQELPEPPK